MTNDNTFSEISRHSRLITASPVFEVYESRLIFKLIISRKVRSLTTAMVVCNRKLNFYTYFKRKVLDSLRISSDLLYNFYDDEEDSNSNNLYFSQVKSFLFEFFGFIVLICLKFVLRDLIHDRLAETSSESKHHHKNH